MSGSASENNFIKFKQVFAQKQIYKLKQEYGKY